MFGTIRNPTLHASPLILFMQDTIAGTIKAEQDEDATNPTLPSRLHRQLGFLWPSRPRNVPKLSAAGTRDSLTARPSRRRHRSLAEWSPGSACGVACFVSPPHIFCVRVFCLL